MGTRLTPADGQPMHCASSFLMQATSAESNVVSVASFLGLPVKVLTAFAKDSPIARFIKDDLAGRHIAYEGPEAGGVDLAAKIDSFMGMIDRAKKAFPRATVFATTLREVLSANSHLWGAIMAEGANWHVVEPREITVLDRIGGGDGFVGGMLYAILRGWEPEKWVRFGWSTGALATTMLTDYCQPADEDQVWSIWEGNARVRR